MQLIGGAFTAAALGGTPLVAGATREAPLPPQTVVIPSGSLRLKAALWMPKGTGPFPAVLFSHGSGGADSDHTAGLTMTEAAEVLGPLFARHGYAFLYLFRRGHGPSADQGPFMQDLLQHEEAARGKEARQHLQFILVTMDHLDDVLAAFSFLKTAPGIDARRIGLVGHSLGGQISLLAAERDSDVRAAVTFGAAAGSWDRSPELRERLLAAVRKTAAPVMLIHAQNDFSTTPGQALADELERLHRPHVLKIYPPVGQTPDSGHNMLYTAIPVWEADVFAFLDKYVRYASRAVIPAS
jgi:dienelactone hydrolase